MKARPPFGLRASLGIAFGVTALVIALSVWLEIRTPGSMCNAAESAGGCARAWLAAAGPLVAIGALAIGLISTRMTLGLTRENSTRQLRPYLLVDRAELSQTPGPQTLPKVYVTVRAFGAAPALDVRFDAHLSFRDFSQTGPQLFNGAFGDPPPPYLHSDGTVSTTNLGADPFGTFHRGGGALPALPSGTTHEFVYQPVPTMHGTWWDMVEAHIVEDSPGTWATTYSPYFEGSIRYTDGRGNRYVTRFAFAVPGLTYSGDSRSDRLEMTICDSGNEIT